MSRCSASALVNRLATPLLLAVAAVAEDDAGAEVAADMTRAEAQAQAQAQAMEQPGSWVPVVAAIAVGLATLGAVAFCVQSQQTQTPERARARPALRRAHVAPCRRAQRGSGGALTRRVTQAAPSTNDKTEGKPKPNKKSKSLAKKIAPKGKSNGPTVRRPPWRPPRAARAPSARAMVATAVGPDLTRWRLWQQPEEAAAAKTRAQVQAKGRFIAAAKARPVPRASPRGPHPLRIVCCCLFCSVLQPEGYGAPPCAHATRRRSLPIYARCRFHA